VTSFQLIFTLAAGTITGATPSAPLPGVLPGETPLPRYLCFRAADPIVVDGTLNENSWRDAQPTTAFLTWDGKDAGNPVHCQAVWDDNVLYFAFRCPDKNIVAVYRERDQNLWEHDVVEMFIDPEGTLRMYTEIIVNPLNVVFDAYQVTNSTHDAPEISFVDWDAKRMKTSVQVAGKVKTPDIEPAAPDQEWTAEVSIPFDTFVRGIHLPPQPGDVWRVALTRYDGRDATDSEFYHYAWSPPYKKGWPHILRRMGYFEFSDKVVGN
jgi:hypothetical protein